MNVFSCQIDDALSGLDRSPGYVRRDDSVGRIEKRIVRAWRFCRQHIRSKTGKFAAAESGCAVCLVEKSASGAVDKKSSILHEGQRLGVDHALSFRGERTVQAYNIGLLKDLLFGGKREGNVRWWITWGAAVGQDGHAEIVSHLSHAAADGAKADYTQSEAVKKDGAFQPVAPCAALNPVSRVNAGGVLADVAADVQNESHGMLGYVSGSVRSDIADRDSVLVEVGKVDVVIPRGKEADEAHAGAEFPEIFSFQRNFVDGQDRSVFCAFPEIFKGGFVVEGCLPEFHNGRPVKISGIEALPIENCDSHC